MVAFAMPLLRMVQHACGLILINGKPRQSTHRGFFCVTPVGGWEFGATQDEM
jgi:hypothetical protein